MVPSVYNPSMNTIHEYTGRSGNRIHETHRKKNDPEIFLYLYEKQ